MRNELIMDDRTHPSHAIRTKGGRRIKKNHFHLLKRPFKDSNGRWVNMDRRSGDDRRIN